MVTSTEGGSRRICTRVICGMRSIISTVEGCVHAPVNLQDLKPFKHTYNHTMY